MLTVFVGITAIQLVAALASNFVALDGAFVTKRTIIVSYVFFMSFLGSALITLIILDPSLWLTELVIAGVIALLFSVYAIATYLELPRLQARFDKMRLRGEAHGAEDDS